MATDELLGSVYVRDFLVVEKDMAKRKFVPLEILWAWTGCDVFVVALGLKSPSNKQAVDFSTLYRFPCCDVWQ